MRIIITGTIGCGKSTVTQALLQHLPGYALVSADDLVRQLYDGPNEFTAEVLRLFGTANRKEVARIAFSDAARRAQLVALSLEMLGPVVDAVFARENVLFEFPLFYENPRWVHAADFVIALHCDEATQRARVKARDGLDDAAIDRVLAAQLSSQAKVALADADLDTGGTLEGTLVKTAALAKQLQAEALRRRCAAFFKTEALWPAIADAYGEPHRAYHTLSHLAELFEHLAPFRGSPCWPAVETAVWFHDFVYRTDSTYPDNENASAQAMARLTRQHCPADWLPDVSEQRILAAQLILATATHQIPAYLKDRPQEFEAAALFLDADLAILAADEPRLLAYDEAIVREWADAPGVTPSLFRVGRRGALRKLADRRPLFYSDTFAGQTAKALANLAALETRYAG